VDEENVYCLWQLKSLSLTSQRTLTNTPASAPTPRVVVPGPTKHWGLEPLVYVHTCHGPLHGGVDLPNTLQDKTRTTLTMDDLSAALSDYGINARKPEFYL